MSLPAATSATSPALPPLHRQVRWWILALLFVVTVINFVDRQTLSLVAPILRDSFHLTNTQYSTILSAFQFGMLVGEFPMGLLMDKRGARFGLGFAVLFWSIGNALHAIATSVWQFRLFRFWLGSGECGNYSGGNKVVSQWFPVRERAFAIGIFNSASMVGGLVAALLIPFITLRWGWQMAFLVPSVFGVLWAVVWPFVYRSPDRHPSLSEAEARHIADGADVSEPAAPATSALLRLPQTWGLMACRFLVGPVVHFYLYWTPEFLYRRHGLDLKSIGYFTAITFLCGDVGSIGGGWIAGRLIARGVPVQRARRLTLLIGACCCLGSLTMVVTHATSLAIAAIALVLFGHTFLSANMFASISDVFPSSAVGRVTSLTGIAQGVSAMLFPLLTGFLVDHVSYRPVFLLAAIMPLAGVLVLLMLVRGFGRVKLATSDSR